MKPYNPFTYKERIKTIVSSYLKSGKRTTVTSMYDLNARAQSQFFLYNCMGYYEGIDKNSIPVVSPDLIVQEEVYASRNGIPYEVITSKKVKSGDKNII